MGPGIYAIRLALKMLGPPVPKWPVISQAYLDRFWQAVIKARERNSAIGNRLHDALYDIFKNQRAGGMGPWRS